MADERDTEALMGCTAARKSQRGHFGRCYTEDNGTIGVMVREKRAVQESLAYNRWTTYKRYKNASLSLQEVSRIGRIRLYLRDLVEHVSLALTHSSAHGVPRILPESETYVVVDPAYSRQVIRIPAGEYFQP
ncbi:uncharacterized protein N7515_007076 [Penicillium bovifimosum]|uniref:Uncharacterized protein n=1 Tax=Penicillium bovifimosum TaxID=126998 RepID=A0A9W9GVV9_9EURO|nr:uncharacterized protein N7515_007076 [Penicillium bovifimosum]KAJ5131037.1 hypothetical protein N7515_007076 [Penicillium bovifimosum]